MLNVKKWAGGPGIYLDASVFCCTAVPHSSQLYRDEWEGRPRSLAFGDRG